MTRPVVLISSPRLEAMAGAIAGMGARMGHAWEIAEADRPHVRAIIHVDKFDYTDAFLDGLPGLRLIAVVSVGYDGVDVAGLRARGIEVTHAQGLNAEDVADHAIGLMIAGWRDIVAGDREIREGRWAVVGQGSARPSLKGRRVGVVGLGAIGEAVAIRAEAFGMIPAWWGPRPKGAPWPRAETLLALAHDSDILVVAARADADNVGLVSRPVIEAVGPKGLIVNVARGSLIDEAALIAALKSRKLGRAALDVFEVEPTPAEQWADVPGLTMTPHSGGATLETIPLLIAQSVENTRRLLAGETLLSPVSTT